jgi:hypothetical protein
MFPRDREDPLRLAKALFEADRPILTLMIPPLDRGFWPRTLLLQHAIATLCESLSLEVLDGPLPSVRLEMVNREKRAVIVFGVKRKPEPLWPL